MSVGVELLRHAAKERVKCNHLIERQSGCIRELAREIAE